MSGDGGGGRGGGGKGVCNCARQELKQHCAVQSKVCCSQQANNSMCVSGQMIAASITSAVRQPADRRDKWRCHIAYCGTLSFFGSDTLSPFARLVVCSSAGFPTSLACNAQNTDRTNKGQSNVIHGLTSQLAVELGLPV